jgi:hypothetical protein
VTGGQREGGDDEGEEVVGEEVSARWLNDIDRQARGREGEASTRVRDGMETRDIYKAVERKGRKRRRGI